MKNLKIICIVALAIIICIIIYLYLHLRETSIDYNANQLILDTQINSNEKFSTITVHITGQIASPGLVTLKEGARISDAIEAAGGITIEADINKVNLAYQLSDGQKIYIPSIYDTEEISYIQDSAGNNVIVDSQTSSLVNINTATQTELETLTGVGPSLANNIITYRKENGKFSCIEDLKNVSGIGDAKFNNIKNFICIK